MDNPTLPDPLNATVALLIADADLRALVGDSVFGQELPASMASAEPQDTVMVEDINGVPGHSGYTMFNEPTYNVFCTGQTPARAKQIYLRVNLSLLMAIGSAQ